MSIWDDTRNDWHAADATTEPDHVPPAQRTDLFIHYDGALPLDLLDADNDGDVDADDHAACLAKVRSFQRYHQRTLGWFDLGYTGLVCPHGRAIEGRGVDTRGAHCPGHNRTGYGIQIMIGGDEQPTTAALTRAVRLYNDLCARSGHTLAKRGHRDGIATECPGDVLYEWVHDGMPAPTTGGAQSIPRPRPKPQKKESLTVDLIDLRDVQPYVTGPGVRPLQRLLDVADDGYAGPRTRRALGDAQKRARLTVDHIFGPLTAEALLAGKGGIR